jgi:geranylgeranyl transferase type-2 subunit beta
MRLLGVPIPTDQTEKIMSFIHSCFDEQTGGFGWSSGHDAHITATHYALLVLLQAGHELDMILRDRILEFTSACQRKSDGAMMADQWGESDLRFAYDAACIQKILVGSDTSKWTIDVSKLSKFVFTCQNFDKAFGPNPGLESHAAYTFCAVGCLVLCGTIHVTCEDRWMDQLGHWLAERQTPTGGFNGRPEKAPDVCYSWWITSTLEMIGKSHWIDKSALARFILRSQDEMSGGIADRPECVPDVFHTFFGLAGLSLIDPEAYGLAGRVDVQLSILAPSTGLS